jgi:hypothetical protein
MAFPPKAADYFGCHFSWRRWPIEAESADWDQEHEKIKYLPAPRAPHDFLQERKPLWLPRNDQNKAITARAISAVPIQPKTIRRNRTTLRLVNRSHRGFPAD